MPQFDNTPNQPLNIDRSRQRLKDLVNKDDDSSSTVSGVQSHINTSNIAMPTPRQGTVPQQSTKAASVQSGQLSQKPTVKVNTQPMTAKQGQTANVQKQGSIAQPMMAQKEKLIKAEEKSTQRPSTKIAAQPKTAIKPSVNTKPQSIRPDTTVQRDNRITTDQVQKASQQSQKPQTVVHPQNKVKPAQSVQSKQVPSMKPSSEKINEPVLKEEPVDTLTEAQQQSVNLDLTGLKPYQTEYWYKLWNKYIKGDHIIDPQRKKVVIEILMPQDNEIEMAAAEQMYSSFIGIGKKPGKVFETIVGLFPKTEIFFRNHDDAISFEIIADENMVRFIVVVPDEWQQFIERQIHGAYPEAEIVSTDIKDFLLDKGNVKVNEMLTKGKVFYPIKVIEDFETDPISSITTTISKLTPGERVIIQFLLQPADNSWHKAGSFFLHKAQGPPKDPDKPPKYVDPQIIEAVQQKISKQGFRVTLRVLVQTQDEFQTDSIMKQLTGAFDQYSHPHLASFKKNKKFKIKEKTVEEFVTRSFPSWGNYPIFNALELATLYHFPNQEIQTPRIHWLRTRKSAPPTNMPTEGLYLGKSEYRNNEVKVKVKVDDRRRHLYIIGQTGSGKTQFLQHLAYQDIINGDGVCFIDPHGDAAERLLAAIPKERAEDVIYFNPYDVDRPMGINILDVNTEEEKHMTVNSFIALLYKLYDPNRTGMVGPQLERAVRNVMLTAMSEPGNSMVEVLRLLTNPKYVEKKLPLIKDPLVKTYWTEQIAQTSDHQRSETLGYFVSKFDRFVTEKLMRNIIGQSQSAFDFRDIMDNQKIMLINLSKGRIGEENSSFLGLLLVPRILAAAMGRADMPEAERKDFYLYVDEFQNFATTDFAQILSEARKYRLCLTVANQFISQIQEDIRNAVFGNVGTMTSFRIGADDGEYMEKQFEPVFNQADLINQKVGECMTKLLIDGQPSRPFSFRTDWAEIQKMPNNPKVAEVIREISRLKYGRDRKIVEREIATRAGFE